MEYLDNGQHILRIVITGGPCSGKTTALERLPDLLAGEGYHILIMPETATQLISGGISPWTCRTPVSYQKWQMTLQLAKEEVYTGAAREISEAFHKPVLILYDRGMPDNKAYMEEEDYRSQIGDLGLEPEDVFYSYDAVFHLLTAADGARDAYNCSNNNARTETVDEAIRVDGRTYRAWEGHPKHVLIDNSTDFEGKLNRLYEGILDVIRRENFSSLAGEKETGNQKMKLTILGTGNALATRCYNTCFIIEDQGQCLLVDGGGGSEILRKIRDAGYQWTDIHHIFVTHKHVDHIMGIIWMVRVICHTMNTGEYEGEGYIYGHDEVIGLVRDISEKLLNANELRHIDERLHLVIVEDGEEFEVIGHRIQAFDIHSTKAKQFGFTLYYGDGKKLTCCGDEPYSDYEEPYAAGSDWLLHEAFCLFGQADHFHPYDHHHSTVREASQLAERLHAKNLLLYHTEDENIARRKELYTKEGQTYYQGNLFVPDDMDVIEID